MPRFLSANLKLNFLSGLLTTAKTLLDHSRRTALCGAGRKKGLILFFISLSWCSGIAQSSRQRAYIIGDWKCVKHDYRGLEKFSPEQAGQIRKSILHVEQHTYCFRGVKFKPQCSFEKWQILPFDFSVGIGSIQRTFSKAQLKK
jgi:hypothetical protein